MQLDDRLYEGSPPAWVSGVVCFMAGVMAGWAWHLYWVTR